MGKSRWGARLLLIRGGAVGDFVVTLPVVRALRHAMPQAWIELLGQSSRAVLACHPRYADRVTDMDAVGFHRAFQEEGHLPAALTEYLQSWTHIVSYVPARHTALATNLRRVCRGEVIVWTPHPDGSRHITDHLLQAVADWIPAGAEPSPCIYVDAEAETVAERLWQEMGLPSSGVLAVHPGSGGRHKLWPLQGWREVMAWAARQGIPGVVICGPAEEERLGERLQQELPPLWHWLRQLTLPQLAAFLARCQVVLGHDSGVSHLAAAVGTTVLALFGPTSPYVWGPRSHRACVLHPQVPQPLTLRNLPPQVVIRTLDTLVRRDFPWAPSSSPCMIVPVVP
jgi:heptosyltransferase-2